MGARETRIAARCFFKEVFWEILTLVYFGCTQMINGRIICHLFMLIIWNVCNKTQNSACLLNSWNSGHYCGRFIKAYEFYNRNWDLAAKESGTRWRIVRWIKAVLWYSWVCELSLFRGSENEWNSTQNSFERKQGWAFAEEKQKRASWEVSWWQSGSTQSRVWMGMPVHRCVKECVRTKDESCQLSLTLFLKQNLTVNLSSQRCSPFLLLLQCRKPVNVW